MEAGDMTDTAVPPPPRFTFDVMSIAGGPRTLADIGCCFLCLYFESMTVGLARSGYFRSKALFLSCADVWFSPTPQIKVVRRML